MSIYGKQATIFVLVFMGLVAALLGPQLMYEYSEGGVNYSVYLEEFVLNGDNIYGRILLKVENTNNLNIKVNDISLRLFDPYEDKPFLTVRDEGATIEANGKLNKSKAFFCKYSEIPDHEIRVVLNAFVVWQGVGNWVTKEFLIPIIWS